jgi:hypothetical protein
VRVCVSVEEDEKKTGIGRAGAELTREALCRLIECMARAKLAAAIPSLPS